MRLILILIVLAVVGLLAARQLSAPPPPPRADGLPQAPTRPQDLQTFERDLNRQMEENAREQARRLREAEGN